MNGCSSLDYQPNFPSWAKPQNTAAFRGLTDAQHRPQLREAPLLEVLAEVVDDVERLPRQFS